jgi:hypothetical protein
VAFPDQKPVADQMGFCGHQENPAGMLEKYGKRLQKNGHKKGSVEIRYMFNFFTPYERSPSAVIVVMGFGMKILKRAL